MMKYEYAPPMRDYYKMAPAIDSTRLRLNVGTTPRTGSRVVNIDLPGILSLGNREERKAVRRLATKLLELCDAHEQPICRDPAHCQGCGYLDAECKCA
jgi:hypothetical protein